MAALVQASYHFSGEVNFGLRLADFELWDLRTASVCSPEGRFAVDEW